MLTGLLLACCLAGCGTSVGDDCSTNTDCSAAGLICDTSPPDGYCYSEGCWEDGDCPEDGVCVTFPNGDRFCLKGCSSGDDCRDGYSCIEDLAGQPGYCYVR